MPTSEQVHAAVAAYGAAYASRDRAAFLAAFSPDAVQVDPYPAPANVGHEAIGGFFDNAMNMGPDLTLNVERTIVCGDIAAVDFNVRLTSGGMLVGFSGVDVFTVNDAGLITNIVAYWDPSTVGPVAG
jgi:steroid Delta-isomerase